jgi:hypothetical protein
MIKLMLSWNLNLKENIYLKVQKFSKKFQIFHLILKFKKILVILNKKINKIRTSKDLENIFNNKITYFSLT